MALDRGFNSTMTPEIFAELYSDYLNELNEYKGVCMTQDEIRLSCIEIIKNINNGNCILYPVKNYGFFILGINENKHPRFEYYIEETYIKPEFRKNGIMRRLVKKALNEQDGAGTLYILNKNEVGYRFWKSIGRLIQLNDNFDNCPDCTQYILAGIFPR